MLSQTMHALSGNKVALSANKVFHFLTSMDMVSLLAVFAISFAFSLLEYFFSYRMIPKFRERNQHWRMALATAAHYPAQVFIWGFFISHAVSLMFLSHAGKTALAQFITARKVFLLLDLLWFVMRFVSQVELIFTEFSNHHRFSIKDKTKVGAIAQLARVVIIALVALALLPTLGISISGVLTLGGVTGVVLGFAAKDTLANFFGGMMIYFDRPFSVGDWVRVPGGHIEGTVESIGWRLTRIRTFSKNLLYVPNGLFSSVSIENPSRMSHRRIKTVIGLRYQDLPVLKDVLSSIEAMLREHPGIDSKQTLFVKFSAYGESSVNMTVYTFTKTVNWVEFESVRQDVYLEIARIVHEHGADFAFPTQTLHIAGDSELPA